MCQKVHWLVFQVELCSFFRVHQGEKCFTPYQTGTISESLPFLIIYERQLSFNSFSDAILSHFILQRDPDFKSQRVRLHQQNHASNLLLPLRRAYFLRAMYWKIQILTLFMSVKRRIKISNLTSVEYLSIDSSLFYLKHSLWSLYDYKCNLYDLGSLRIFQRVREKKRKKKMYE